MVKKVTRKKNINESILYTNIMNKVSKILKESLLENELNVKDFLIVEAWNTEYDYLVEEYADALVSTDYGNFFILPRKDMSSIYSGPSRFARPTNEIKFYTIPSIYDTLDEVEEDLKNGVLDPEDDTLKYNRIWFR